MSEVVITFDLLEAEKVSYAIMTKTFPQSYMMRLINLYFPPLPVCLCTPAASNIPVKCSLSAVAFLSSGTKRGAKTICPWPALLPGLTASQ